MDRETLLEAVETGEILTVIYHGGSHHGIPRQIAPIQVDDRMVLARCYISERVKRFVIEKLELAAPGVAPASIDVASATEWPIPTSVEELVEKYRSRLSDMGWSMASGEDFILLHHGAGRKRLLRNPEVELRYEDNMDSYEVSETGRRRWMPKERKRPWLVGSRDGRRSYARFSSAAQRFLKQAAAHVPRPDTGVTDGSKIV